MGHQTRIMYIENKGGGYVEKWGQQVPSGGELTGPGRIGRATFSKTGKTIYYGGKTFNRWNGDKTNYVCEETGESYWISGPKRRGGDSLYATNIATELMRTFARNTGLRFAISPKEKLKLARRKSKRLYRKKQIPPLRCGMTNKRGCGISAV